MENQEFIEKLKQAFEECGGDLWAFWAAMNPDKPREERTTKERIVYLYCNPRKNKDGSTWIKRNARIDGGDVYEFEFRTGTIPKYHGNILLQDYILSESNKRVIVYKFEFLASPKKSDIKILTNCEKVV